MRSLIFVLIAAFSVSAFAKPEFSAFIEGTNLHVTIIADSCNHYGASLTVDPLCNKDRWTRNLAPVCPVQLRIVSTRMACPPPNAPKVLSIDLKETQVDLGDLRELEITYGSETVTVPYK